MRRGDFGINNRDQIPLRYSENEREVGVAGFLTRRGNHGVHLPAVVRLVIEEMRHQETDRLVR